MTNDKSQRLQSASGTGLAFIIFTEAINQFPGAQFWSILFFLMLFTLGIDSQFGTLEGVVTSIVDMKLFPNLRKEILTGISCNSKKKERGKIMDKKNSDFVRRCDLFGMLYNFYGLRSWSWQLRLRAVRQFQRKLSIAHNRVLRMYRSILCLRFEEVSIKGMSKF